MKKIGIGISIILIIIIFLFRFYTTNPVARQLTTMPPPTAAATPTNIYIIKQEFAEATATRQAINTVIAQSLSDTVKIPYLPNGTPDIPVWETAMAKKYDMSEHAIATRKAELREAECIAFGRCK